MSNFPKNFETEIVNYDLGDVLANTVGKSGRFLATGAEEDVGIYEPFPLGFRMPIIKKGFRNCSVSAVANSNISCTTEISNDGVNWREVLPVINFSTSGQPILVTLLFPYIRYVVTNNALEASTFDLMWSTNE